MQGALQDKARDEAWLAGSDAPHRTLRIDQLQRHWPDLEAAFTSAPAKKPSKCARTGCCCFACQCSRQRLHACTDLLQLLCRACPAAHS